MRSVLSTALVSVLLIQLASDARAIVPAPERATGRATARASNAAEGNSDLKRQILEMPPRAVVELRLRDKERVRGRLVDVGDDSFVVKVTKADKTEDRRIAFADVHAIKRSGSHTFRNLAILGAIVAGIAITIAVLANVTSG